ncbi:hypothetical protein AMAG_19576 [Allomyces macrogynus ATCC 38327]|uniref:MYND-type domain-containing protein n=1 Tax=Allomyces macrogynus (strain ATCC 38327) TaxID=578462 RepID=A0A0L0SVP8_ALLM3|nr:hypothetical protein AMAG_19576 [Allomyces macrogynus ATCC 38327]|eukprot:KNE66419.1 hypothetical protein AMAG_19576 [Allomyces macrogynus ATCC 38327]
MPRRNHDRNLQANTASRTVHPNAQYSSEQIQVLSLIPLLANLQLLAVLTKSRQVTCMQMIRDQISLPRLNDLASKTDTMLSGNDADLPPLDLLIALNALQILDNLVHLDSNNPTADAGAVADEAKIACAKSGLVTICVNTLNQCILAIQRRGVTKPITETMNVDMTNSLGNSNTQSARTASDPKSQVMPRKRDTSQIIREMAYPKPFVPGVPNQAQITDVILGLVVRILATLAAHPAVRVFLRRPLGESTTAFHLAEWLLTVRTLPSSTRQSVVSLMSHSTELLAESGARYCAHLSCNTIESSAKPFSRCSRCKCTWYCSRECQIAAWKQGHKHWCRPAPVAAPSPAPVSTPAPTPNATATRAAPSPAPTPMRPVGMVGASA